MRQLDKAQIERQFTKSAYSYDDVAVMQRNIVDQLVNNMLQLPVLEALASEDGCAVDLGCGTGYGLTKLTEHYPMFELHGVDLASGMIEVAKQRHPTKSFIKADIEKLPYTNQMFDAVFSSSTLQWCDFSLALSEIKRVTKPGGRMFASTFTDGTLCDWRALWNNKAGCNEVQKNNTQLEQQVGFLTITQIKTALEAAGFTQVCLTSQLIEQSFDSFQGAVDSIRQLGAGYMVQQLSLPTSRGLMGKQRYRHIKQQVNDIIDRDGVIVLPYYVVYISACLPDQRTVKV